MNTPTYAGFWIRFLASIIDSLITNIGVFIIGFILGFMLAVMNPELPEATYTVVGMLVGIVGFVLYHAYFESSHHQATPGKIALGLKVYSDSGNRLSFGQAAGRTASKYLSLFLLMIGYMMAGWTQKKQALHDFIAGSVVVHANSVPNATKTTSQPAQETTPSPSLVSDNPVPQDRTEPYDSDAVTRALSALNKLHKQGALTDDEYSDKKNQLLARL